jgi:hypothetical protein
MAMEKAHGTEADVAAVTAAAQAYVNAQSAKQ